MTQQKTTQIQIPHSRIHFIGIGGSGMAPLAELAFHLGFKVTGSDLTHSDTIDILKKQGISISLDQSANNPVLKENPTIIFSSAIKSSNIEFQEAITRQLHLMHRSDLLNYFLSSKEKSITVAGTNGKSTSSAMISFMLYQLRQDPLAVIGAHFKDIESLSLSGKNGNCSVAEADESDGTFLKYQPYIGVLTSVDLDHMDYYKDHEHIFNTFESYLSNIKDEGYAILNIDDPYCKTLSQKIQKKKITYGFHPEAQVHASNYICKNGETYFSLNILGKTYKSHLKSIGKHNVENALTAFSTALALGLNIQDSIDAMECFTGIRRRLETIYHSSHVHIYDDYAHNPTKIKTVIKALRNSYPNFHITVIFQPHRYSRIKTLYNNFIGSFTDANSVIVLPIYSSGEEDLNPVLSESLVSDIEKASKVSCTFAGNFHEAEEKVVQTLKNDSIIITLGAGDVWHLAFKLKERLA